MISAKPFISILRRCRKTEKNIIVGAGKIGKELYNLLYGQKIIVYKFFDNDQEKMGNRIDNVEIVPLHKIEDENCLYIIAIENPDARQDLYAQLQELGINADRIIAYAPVLDYEYISQLDEEDYQDTISSQFLSVFGREMDWENPRTYNEKICWEKLNAKDPRRTRFADKYLVRDWVKEQIGEEHLTRHYGVWDNANDIDFNELPSQFALKTTHSSAMNIIVKDKSKLDIPKAVNQLNYWMGLNCAYYNLELHYKDIKPRIICEEYLEGLAEDVYDYNIYCFNGEPKYIWCIKGSHNPDCKASFYDLNWQMQPFSMGYPKDEIPAPRPEKLDEMLRLSRILCKDFNHVRVDWFSMPDGRVLFGEMTFSTCGGLQRFIPEEYDEYFGNLIEY